MAGPTVPAGAAGTDGMAKDAVPSCPYCKNGLKPERIGAGHYLCPCCSREWTIPKG